MNNLNDFHRTKIYHIKISKMYPDVQTPKYGTENSAGFDFYIHHFERDDGRNPDSILLKPLDAIMVGTGIKMEIPCGYYLEVAPRSGLACKKGITLRDSPAIIDSDYRGEIKLCIINMSNENQVIDKNIRIAQGILQPYTHVASFDIVSEEELSKTDRDSNGFGSTGFN